MGRNKEEGDFLWINIAVPLDLVLNFVSPPNMYAVSFVYESRKCVSCRNAIMLCLSAVPSDVKKKPLSALLDHLNPSHSMRSA